MIRKNNFFKSYFKNSKKYNINLKKTKKAFSSFLKNLEDNKFPLLNSYKKDYEFNFSKETIKKFSKYKNIIIIGMGGSILGSKSIYSFFKKKIKKELFFFDNLDPNLNEELRKKNFLKKSCFIIVSKSGNTLETITNFNTLNIKKSFKNKIIFITEITKNQLISLANNYKAAVIEHNDYIGGRFSVLSEASMFPASLMKLNINKFKNLEKLINDKNFVNNLIQNVASIYTYNMSRINNSVILNYDSDLTDLGYWYQQLVAESLGKNGKGLTPIVSTCPRDHHSLLQLYLDGPKDKFFTFFSPLKTKKTKVESIIDAQCEATKNIFKKKKIPFRHFVFKKNSEEELGSIFTFFVLETILLADLMNVNSFDQPAVEDVKIETKNFLS